MNTTNKIHLSMTVGSVIGMFCAGTALADFNDAVVVRYSVQATEYDGTPVSVMVEDLYLLTDDPKDVDLNIYDLDLVRGARVPYFQSSTAPTWLPGNLGDPFDSTAVQFADSFVTVGGFAGGTTAPAQIPGVAPATGIDPFFGGETVAYPQDRAGWYNGSPPNLQGLATSTPAGLGVLIGRFAHDGEFSLVGSTFSATWNQGLGTPGVQAGFTVREFIDCNGNIVEDALEIADPSIPPSETAIRWEVADGGNGHWYELVTDPTTIPDADLAARARGGYLATFSLPGENTYVANAFQFLADSASVGGIQRQPAVEPIGSWFWDTNEPWNGVDWNVDEPNDTAYFGGTEGRMEIYLFASRLGRFNDVSGDTPRAYLIEWDAAADCNGNGILDTCDLASGLESDLNGNRIPDSCEALEVPGEYATIQSAIDAAPEGGVVLVEPGTYNETLLFPEDGRNLVLASVAGPLQTTIDGSGLEASVIQVSGGQTLRTRIQGFQVTGGEFGSQLPGVPAFVGGGLLVFNADLDIDNCIFEANRSGFGGNAYVLESAGEIRNCSFSDGFAQSDGGNLMLFRSETVVTNCTMTDGRAVNDGGGIKVVYGNVDMIDCAIAGNLANTGGGAMYFESPKEPSSFNFLRCDVVENNAKFGGGFWSRPTENGPNLADTTVCENEPDNFFGPYNDLGGNTLCVCIGDLNNDDLVNGVDLGLWLAVAGLDCPANGFCPEDFNGDGSITGGDLGVLLANWGVCQP